MNHRSITSTDELLALVNEDPQRRIVAYIDLPEGGQGAVVAQFDSEHLIGNATVLAIVAEGGTAEATLQAAADADRDGDSEAWTALPFRYVWHEGPAWVSAANGLAPERPSGGDQGGL